MNPAPQARITERIDAITRISDRYRRAAPPCPRSVKIELTARCNYACSFCARSMRLRDQKDMDHALFSRLALEMRAAGVEELGLCCDSRARRERAPKSASRSP